MENPALPPSPSSPTLPLPGEGGGIAFVPMFPFRGIEKNMEKLILSKLVLSKIEALYMKFLRLTCSCLNLRMASSALMYLFERVKNK